MVTLELKHPDQVRIAELEMASLCVLGALENMLLKGTPALAAIKKIRDTLTQSMKERMNLLDVTETMTVVTSERYMEIGKGVQTNGKQ